MNNIIKEQLNKCKVAYIPPFDDNTTLIHIKPISKIESNQVLLNHYYLIELEDYIINPPPNFDLHINWNNNIIPKSKGMKCEIIQIMGKMVKINGVGFDLINNNDLNVIWGGWLPMKSFKVIKEL